MNTRILLLLLLLPFCSYAQEGEVSINYGTSFQATAAFKIVGLKIGAGYGAATLKGKTIFGDNIDIKINYPFFLLGTYKKHKKHDMYIFASVGPVSVANKSDFSGYTYKRGTIFGAEAGYSYRLVHGLYVNGQLGYQQYSATFHGVNSDNFIDGGFLDATIGLHYIISAPVRG